MEPNPARLRTSRPPSLYAMSSRMVLQLFGQRPVLTFDHAKHMREHRRIAAATSGSQYFPSLRESNPRSSLPKAPGLPFEKSALRRSILAAKEVSERTDKSDQAMASCSSDGCMDDPSPASLWGALPGDMQALVLAKLPFRNLIGLRRVCRKWNEMILAMWSFPHGMEQNLSPKCVPLHFEEGLLVLYNSVKRAWEEQSLDFLGVPPESLLLEASSHGLLCFQELSSKDFIVLNPITRRWKQVPLPPGFTHDNITGVVARSHRPVPTKEGGREAIDAFLRSYGKEVVCGIINDCHSRNYKLIVAGIPDNNGRRGTLIFDSLTNAWKNGGAVPVGVRFWESGKAVYGDSYFYCLTYSIGLPKGSCQLDQPWSVIRYNVASDKWGEVNIVKKGTVLPQLVEQKGRVLLAQRHFSPLPGNHLDEVTFSEVEEFLWTATWLIVKSFPLEFFSGDKARAGQIIEDWCVGQGGLMYVAGQERDCGGGSRTKGRSLAMLALDFTLDTWTPLPTLSLHGGYYPARSLHVIEPSLVAQP